MFCPIGKKTTDSRHREKTGLVRAIACAGPSIFMNLLVPENKNGFIYPS